MGLNTLREGLLEAMSSLHSTPVTVQTQRSWTGVAIAGTLVAVGVGLVALVAMLPVKKEAPPPPEVVPVNVEVLTVTPIPEIPDVLQLTAVVEPEATVRVAAEMAGRVERYGERSAALTWLGQAFTAGAALDEGQPVRAGDVLIHLNADVITAQVDRNRAQAEYDEREFRRQQDLFERGNSSRTELDDARTRRDMSKAALDESLLWLERTQIKAPSDGVLNKWSVELGEYAAPGDMVAEIVKLDPVKVVVAIPERDVYFFAVGESAQVVARLPESTEVPGTITYISAVADEASRTTRMEISVPNPTLALHSGQIVRVRLTRQILHDVIMIPLASVIPLEEGRIVYVVTADNTAERRDVELGLLKGRDVQINRGLRPGDRLITSGHRLVGPGQVVRVITPPTAPADTQPTGQPPSDARPAESGAAARRP